MMTFRTKILYMMTFSTKNIVYDDFQYEILYMMTFNKILSMMTLEPKYCL